MPTSPTLRLDPGRVSDIAARALQRLQREDPEQFAALGDAVEAGGGGMLGLTLLSDGQVVLTLAGVALWRGPRALVERGNERRFD
jgi:hypothetical protein